MRCRDSDDDAKLDLLDLLPLFDPLELSELLEPELAAVMSESLWVHTPSAR